MAASSPSLSLSDIMHPLSPPPSLLFPVNPLTPPPRPRSSTPEPLEPAEIEEMRRKVVNMGWGDTAKGNQNASSKEHELADMLLRLTHPASLPQASQLHAQAETIANLILQRDFLVKRSVEERERWDSEKESWARAAQALILQGRKELVQAEKDENIFAQYSGVTVDASTQRMQEFERVNVTLHNEKKALQQKLNDTQTRLATLESELAQLKPILLMQPFALVHSHPTGTQHGWTASIPNLTPTRRGRNQEATETLDSDDEPSFQPRPQFRNPVLRPVGSDQLPTTLQPPFPSSPQKKGDYYRRREVPPSSVQYPASTPKTGRRKVGGASQIPMTSRTVLSDARAEHLLLAARKIGMQRATYLSGTFAHLQYPPEPPPQPKQKRPTSPSKLQTPKTPRRNAAANTPLLTRTPLGTSPGQPRTPLQSLLSAAQSVLSAPGSMSTGPPDSPLAKRRKLDHSMTVLRSVDPSTNRKDKGKGKEKETVNEKESEEKPVDITKVKSALDLLADEAEARGTHPPSADDEVDAEGDEDPPHDVDMEDGNEVELEPVDGGRQTSKGNTMTTANPAAAKAADIGEVMGDETAGQSQETANESQGAEFSQPSTSFIHPPPAPTQPTTSSPLNRAEQSSEGSMLAPPIDLTPRASRSPAPSDVQHASRNGSRAQSIERLSSMESASGSFTMFSLQRPQPLAAAGPSVLSSSSGELVEDQGPSMLLTSRIDGVKFIAEDPPRRTRSPYIKWTRDEDELLAKAVAKYGQKWDLVQKELPSRGYHQVRQRWLRKLGVFDGSKLDLASPETNAAAEFLNVSTAPQTDTEAETGSNANLKLDLVSLSHDKNLLSEDTAPDDEDADAEADVDMRDENEQVQTE